MELQGLIHGYPLSQKCGELRAQMSQDILAASRRAESPKIDEFWVWCGICYIFFYFNQKFKWMVYLRELSNICAPDNNGHWTTGLTIFSILSGQAVFAIRTVFTICTITTIGTSSACNVKPIIDFWYKTNIWTAQWNAITHGIDFDEMNNRTLSGEMPQSRIYHFPWVFEYALWCRVNVIAFNSITFSIIMHCIAGHSFSFSSFFNFFLVTWYTIQARLPWHPIPPI